MQDEVIRRCPHCGNTAPQRLALEHEFENRELYEEDGSQSDFSLSSRYEARICRTCNELVLYHEDDISRLHVVYPAGRTLHRAIPAEIQGCYEEAGRVRRASPSSYAVLLRRGLEMVCDDRGIKPGTLHARLVELTSRGELPAVLSDMTNIIRDLGNAGAHTARLKVTVPMTWAMDELFRAVVEYVYVAPYSVEAVKKSLERY